MRKYRVAAEKLKGLKKVFAFVKMQENGSDSIH